MQGVYVPVDTDELNSANRSAGDADQEGYRFYSFTKWDDTLQASFEKVVCARATRNTEPFRACTHTCTQHFYVPATPAEDHAYMIETSLVNRRPIYKDVIGCTQPWSVEPA